MRFTSPPTGRRRSTACPTTDCAGRVGNGNTTCEGIEICEATNASDFWKGIDIAADVIAQRLRAHGWGVDRMHPHSWFSQTYGGSDHTDPIPYFSRYGYTWPAFIQLVQQKLSGNTGTQEVDIMAAMMIRNDSTGVIWYCEPGKGRTALTHPDQANLLQQAGVPLIHGNNGAPWWSRFDPDRQHGARHHEEARRMNRIR